MTVRQRGASQVSVRPEKNTRTISFTVTKAEKDDIKKYLTHFGELSHVIRSAVRKWLVEKKKQEELLQTRVETQEKEVL